MNLFYLIFKNTLLLHLLNPIKFVQLLPIEYMLNHNVINKTNNYQSRKIALPFSIYLIIIILTILIIIIIIIIYIIIIL